MEEKKIIINGHEAVDLGLSVKWATCNVGASKPEEFGDHFAWGETEPKDEYSDENYMFYDVINGRTYIDIGSVISGTEFDAARELLGEDWRMPNEEELYELLRECSWEMTTINGVKGYRVIGPNCNSIFLPAWIKNSQNDEYEEYWTGSFSDEDCHWDALCLEVTDDEHYSAYAMPYDGLLIRPVTDK